MAFPITNTNDYAVPSWYYNDHLINSINTPIRISDYYRCRTRLSGNPIFKYLMTPYLMNNKSLRIKAFNIGRYDDPSYIARNVLSTINAIHNVEQPYILAVNAGSKTDVEAFSNAVTQESNGFRFVPTTPIVRANLQIQGRHTVNVFTTEAKPNIIIFISVPLNLGSIIKLISLLPALFPYYYGAETMANTDLPCPIEDPNFIIDLYRAANNLNDSEFDRRLKQWVQEYSKTFNDQQRNRALKAFAETAKVSILNHAQTNVRRASDEVIRLETALENAHVTLRNARKELLFMTDATTTLEEYNKFLEKQTDLFSINFRQNILSLGFCVPCTNYDRSIVERLLNASNNNYITQYHLEKLYKALFLEDRYTLYISSVIEMNFINNTVANNNYEVGSMGIPNPHFTEYRCWGSYGPIIQQAMQKNDFISATLAVKAAIANLNFTDATVMSVLAERFSRTTNNSYNSVPAVKDEETGELMTINQLKEKLNEDN